MDLEQHEALCIAQYCAGWNDAQCGRAPKDGPPSYALGYMDALATTFG